MWLPTTVSKNRDRWLTGHVAAAFFDAVLIHADTARLLSDEHFTIDGTLLDAWASQKSFRPRDQDPPVPGGGHPTVDFRGQHRTNATHGSTTDPDARLYKKARRGEARLGYLGHGRMEHRSGLIVDARVTPADGHGERDAAVLMTEARPAQFATTPRRHSAMDGRTTRHPGYAISQQKRTLVEQGFGWMQTIGGLRKLRPRGGPLVSGSFPSPRPPTTSSDVGDSCRRPHDSRRLVFVDPRTAASSVPEPKFGDQYSGRGARIARREERAYWA